MNLDVLIKDIQEEFSLDKLAVDTNGIITLNSDGIYVGIIQNNESFLLLTRLCSLPENRLPLYTFALSKNNFGALNAHLGIFEKDDSLVLSTKIYCHCFDKNYFFKQLSNHCATAHRLLEELVQFQ